MRPLLLAALLCAGCLTPRASLPVFGPGPVTNLGACGGGQDWNASACDRPLTNSVAHVGWGLAIPALGHVVAGRSGMRWAGALWIAETLVSEAFFHAPPGPLNDAYSAEVRTDLLTRIVPTLLLLGADWLLEAP